jgi:TolB-like protein
MVGLPASLSAATGAALCVALVCAPAAGQAPATRRPTLIVFNIVPEKGVERGAANLLTELVLDKVAKLQKHVVIGQKDIEKMLFWEKEKLKLCTEGSCLAEIAGAMGADLYVEGSIGVMGDRYMVNLKLMDARGVRVVERTTEVVKKDENAAVDAMARCIGKIMGAPPGQPGGPAGSFEAGAVPPGLLQEYEQAAVQFRVVAKNALSDRGMAGFTAKYRAARDQMKVMAKRAAEIQAVANAPFAAFEQDSAVWRSVLARRTEFVSQFQVCLQFHSDLDPETSARLTSLVAGALYQMGVASTSGSGCGGGIVLRVDCKMNCRQGHLGPTCHLEMNGTLSNTARGEKLAKIPFGEAFKGAHGNDPEKAKKKACDAVTNERVKAALEGAFAAVLPLD